MIRSAWIRSKISVANRHKKNHIAVANIVDVSGDVVHYTSDSAARARLLQTLTISLKPALPSFPVGFLLLLPLIGNCPAVPPSSWIVLVTVLVSYLPARFATARVEALVKSINTSSFQRVNAPILPALLKAWIQVCPYDSLIEFGTSYVFHTVQCILMVVVFHKAKAARGLVKPIKAHDKSLNFSTSANIQRSPSGRVSKTLT